MAGLCKTRKTRSLTSEAGEDNGTPQMGSDYDSPPSTPDKDIFAPRGIPKARLLRRPVKPLDGATTSPFIRIRDLLRRTWSFRLGAANNERFLERFRYIIIASQLLNGHCELLPQDRQAQQSQDGTGSPLQTVQEADISINLVGVLVTAATSFILVYCIRGALDKGTLPFLRSLSLIVITSTVIAIMLTVFAQRQQLKRLRNRAVKSIEYLVDSVQDLTASTSAVITLVQEIELVSRGFRLSTPMPPISRLEQKENRRCIRLRRNLRTCFTLTIPLFCKVYTQLRSLVDEDDLDRLLDVYDVTDQDVQTALIDSLQNGEDDQESLRCFRMLQHRLFTLRKLVLLALLALNANSSKEDMRGWEVAVSQMNCLSAAAAEASEKLTKKLAEEEGEFQPGGLMKRTKPNIEFVMPPTPKDQVGAGKENLRSQVRQLSSLSQGIRDLHAKMQLLREECNSSLEMQTKDLTGLGSRLLTQYEAIGADIKALMHAWDNGRAHLLTSFERHERRVSGNFNSPKLVSPRRSPSLGGLTAVDETSPANGTRRLSDDGYTRLRSSLSPSPSAASAEEETSIFEGISMPTKCIRLPREQRILKMQEERVRQASARERREASQKMLHELESVISMKGKRHASSMSTGNISGL